MNEDFLIVHKSILPECFVAVLRANSLVDDEGMSVSDACRKTDISRSTFYKYKDKVFAPSSTYGRKAVVALRVADKMGVLSAVLAIIYKHGANVITINQGVTIGTSAYITIVIDVSDMTGDVNEVVGQLRSVEHVRSANVLAVE